MFSDDILQILKFLVTMPWFCFTIWLEYSFGLTKEAAAVNSAMEKVLDSGRVTADLKPTGKPATTEEVGQAVCGLL